MSAFTIVAVGGTSFDVFSGDVFLGRTEFGSLDADGQYEQDNDEIIEHVRSNFGEAEGYADQCFTVR